MSENPDDEITSLDGKNDSKKGLDPIVEQEPKHIGLIFAILFASISLPYIFMNDVSSWLDLSKFWAYITNLVVLELIIFIILFLAFKQKSWAKKIKLFLNNNWWFFFGVLCSSVGYFLGSKNCDSVIINYYENHWVGHWISDEEGKTPNRTGVITFVANEESITGFYLNPENQSVVLSGEAGNNTLAGTWKNRSNHNDGKFVFTMIDSISFEGFYVLDGDTARWNGYKTNDVGVVEAEIDKIEKRNNNNTSETQNDDGNSGDEESDKGATGFDEEKYKKLIKDGSNK